MLSPSACHSRRLPNASARRFCLGQIAWIQRPEAATTKFLDPAALRTIFFASNQSAVSVSLPAGVVPHTATQPDPQERSKAALAENTEHPPGSNAWHSFCETYPAEQNPSSIGIVHVTL